jgi:hypothetical protein
MMVSESFKKNVNASNTYEVFYKKKEAEETTAQYTTFPSPLQ